VDVIGPNRAGRNAAIAVGISLAVAAVVGLLIWRFYRTPQVAVISGAVLTHDPDPHKERPIENATIIAEYGESTVKAKSDSAGFFRLQLQPPVHVGEPVHLSLKHPDYRPFAITSAAGESIHVIRLAPNTPNAVLDAVPKQVTIANVRIRYATKAENTVNVGGIVRTFEILNQGNVPCEGRQPCSPDGRWKATLGSFKIDTGAENKVFRNVRVSCIAGPCPFTSIESDGFSRGGREISVVVRNWSDRVTYVLEAEVVQNVQSEMIRHTYPVVFGRSMSFTLPAEAQGPSIEADVDGTGIVFPLGPRLILSWASCRVETGSDRIRLYRCALKPGYRFE
jgi:hypothetical protein